MTKNVIKFPESLDSFINRKDEALEKSVKDYLASVKRANWFSFGLLVGSVMSTLIWLVIFYFVGVLK